MLALRHENRIQITSLPEVAERGIVAVKPEISNHQGHSPEPHPQGIQAGVEFTVHHVAEILPQAVARVQNGGPPEKARRGSDVAMMMNMDEW